MRKGKQALVLALSALVGAALAQTGTFDPDFDGQVQGVATMVFTVLGVGVPIVGAFVIYRLGKRAANRL